MAFYNSNIKKTQLDFDRPSLVDTTFKKPSNASRKRPFSGKSYLGDDEEGEESNCSSNSTLDSISETINVILRLKPVERIPDVYQFNENTGTATVKVQKQQEHEFKFTSILSQNADQPSVYNFSVKPIMSHPFSSSGASFASYGVSNSGKTYTILGEESSAAGIVPRALTQVFTEYSNFIADIPIVKVEKDEIKILDDNEVTEAMQATKSLCQQSKDTGKHSYNWKHEDIRDEHEFEPIIIDEDSEDHFKIYVWISFVEIYNERISDLFAPPKTGCLKIISNHGNSFVQGLTWLHVENIDQALELLQHGLRRVNYASTGINAHSSRSHTIFTINLISQRNMDYEFANYKFCDLAGAERAKNTGNVGERMKESGGINNSLSVLGKCIKAVSNNQANRKKEIVPVRESKLTLLLQSSLQGQQKFVMIVNLLPTLECFDDNVNVLKFGSKANKIVTRRVEAKKFPRLSYNYFMSQRSQMNSSVMEHEDTILDESSLDLSYEIDVEVLRNMLRKKNRECEVLKQHVEKREREFLVKEQKIRNDMVEMAKKRVEEEKSSFEVDLAVRKSYYEQKESNANRVFNRKLKELEEINEYLERENRKLKKKLGQKSEDDVIELNDSEEDEDEGEEEEEEEEEGYDEIENIEPNTKQY